MNLKSIGKRLVAIPVWPRHLGLGGAIPFVIFGGLPWFQSYHAVVSLHILVAYGAVILSFVGALHWAFAMMALTISESNKKTIYLWSVMPALIGWVALLISQWIALLALLIGFALHCVMDLKLAKSILLPSWYLPLRLMLTTIASLGILSGQIYLLIS